MKMCVFDININELLLEAEKTKRCLVVEEKNYANDIYTKNIIYYISFSTFSGGRPSTALSSKTTMGLSIILG